MNDTYQNPGFGTLLSALTALVWPNAGGAGPRPLEPRRVRLENGRHTRPARPVAKLRLWQERVRQRHELSLLDDHILQDIGLTREQVEAEARKPFWRA